MIEVGKAETKGMDWEIAVYRSETDKLLMNNE